MDDTVDAVTDVQAVVKGLQVDIRRSQVSYLADDGVHKVDDGRLAGQVLEMFDEVTPVSHVLQAVGILGRDRLSQCGLDITFESQIGLHVAPGGQAQCLCEVSILGHDQGGMQDPIFQAQWANRMSLEKI
ncbi:hypothetical protein KYG_02387 [Acidovorax sp. NO-1]|nr:hypothetical protein KYG_02387 [Acidovorax sp. NO-1]